MPLPYWLIASGVKICLRLAKFVLDYLTDDGGLLLRFTCYNYRLMISERYDKESFTLFRPLLSRLSSLSYRKLLMLILLNLAVVCFFYSVKPFMTYLSSSPESSHFVID